MKKHQKERLTTRKDLILELSNQQDLCYSKSIHLNSLILSESKEQLDFLGENCSVNSTSTHVLDQFASEQSWTGSSHFNSIHKMKEYYRYVEGYIISPQGIKLAHAWNYEIHSGIQYDFTIPNNKGFTYFGYIIPDEDVRRIIHKKKSITIPILPFLNER